jgi:diaminohydroxyphosphoribosylaminopyrimidine deaminase/5-amino-6-(5-phosphoribosylamino)uracil reductase
VARRWTEREQELMRAALDLARLGEGATYPNPVVGAVVAKHGRIVGRGFHRRWGLPHAEIEALRDAGKASRGADLYITLEPCCHYGKTPPCTDTIVKSGIKRVFASMLDPNPLVDGKGAAALRRADIHVAIGLEADAAHKLNEAYVTYMRTGRPFVTLKVAQTLDGKIATASGNARWITSAASRRLVRRLRASAQALVVGRRTVEIDDPELLCHPRRRHDYLRCVLDTNLRTSLDARILRTAKRYPVVLYCGEPEGRMAVGQLVRSTRRLGGLKGAHVTAVRTAPGGRLRLEDVLADLASRKVMHVWVEGGAAVFTSFLRAGLADKVLLFVAPRVMGGRDNLSSFGDLGVKSPDECRGFTVDAVEASGDDLLMTLYPGGAARV